jgi:hypothetical protein
MTTSVAELKVKVAAQRQLIPSIYGNVDFDIKPERFTDRLTNDSELPDTHGKRAELLANAELMEQIRAYTMLGDNVADSYAALIPEYGFKRLITLLTEACDHGVESVQDAPPELVAFIREMEYVPDWLDVTLAQEGARLDRNTSAHIQRFAIRGAFIGTFMNKYAALPMAVTGTLSNETAGRRVKETDSFFATTVLPGALCRFGAGFKAAAMVRLMHSMVRYNALRRGDHWDVKIYGIPIPQVDQMVAGGLKTIYAQSLVMLSNGRKTFTPVERARLELVRYRCYLLGLPEDLLPDTPQAIVDIMSARNATLRAGYDDATCGELLRATMAAYLEPDNSVASRFTSAMERSFAKLFFIKVFTGGNAKKAAGMGVRIKEWERLAANMVVLYIRTIMAAYTFASRIPVIRDAADRSLVRKITQRLRLYGHAEFTTNADAYRPTIAKKAV